DIPYTASRVSPAKDITGTNSVTAQVTTSHRSSCLLNLGDGIDRPMTSSKGLNHKAILPFIEDGNYDKATVTCSKKGDILFIPLGFSIFKDGKPETCGDGVKNQDEIGVDCGGTKCNKCGATEGCGSGKDCVSGVCLSNVCQIATCNDKVQNQDETDLDCGGICGACGVGQLCINKFDCDSFRCDTDKTCLSASCVDGIKNQDETDIDCGGATCNACIDGKFCADGSGNHNTYCESQVCKGQICQSPTCFDGVHNGPETGVDCGSGCKKCSVDTVCNTDGDCTTQICRDHDLDGVKTCQAVSCTDKIKNGDETDIDCGGSVCEVCPIGDRCEKGSDCESSVCNAKFCSTPSCSDKTLNGDETDIDCGGSCNKCDGGDHCVVNNDCVSTKCDVKPNPINNICTFAGCFDDILNQDETDVDCGGSCDGLCDIGKQCNTDQDCDSKICELEGKKKLCKAQTCDDGLLNQDETDIDCGGLVCAGQVCGDNKKCKNN
ncbi:MAG: hypothetical protein QF535_06390, partial [Anaerolineales bacterium]|nr:hypothetical protein [Anaerolineales bacterium]